MSEPGRACLKAWLLPRSRLSTLDAESTPWQDRASRHFFKRVERRTRGPEVWEEDRVQRSALPPPWAAACRVAVVAALKRVPERQSSESQAVPPWAAPLHCILWWPPLQRRSSIAAAYAQCSEPALRRADSAQRSAACPLLPWKGRPERQGPEALKGQA